MKKLLLSLFIVTLISPSLYAKSLPNVIEEIKTSVVAVGTYQLKRNPRAIMYGSGVLLSSTGLIATANHVLDSMAKNNEANFLRVYLYNDSQKRGYAATIIAQSPKYDLALLQIEGTDFPYLEKGTSSGLREGDEIAFSGYPYGLLLGMRVTTHRGIISSISPNILPVVSAKELSPAIKRALASKYNILHLDAVAYPGHSGGPLFDPKSGKVLGIITSGLFKEVQGETKFKLPTGISYAIPIEHVEELLPKK